jgi:hypothetical protein
MPKLSDVEIRTGRPGKVKFYSQRVDSPPLVNCRLYVAAMQVRFMGAHVPRDFGMILRKASGVPLRNKKGEGIGTTTDDALRALRLLLPWAQFDVEAIDDGAFFDRLSTGDTFASIAVSYGKLPRRLRRWSPGFEDGHQIGIARSGIRNGVRKVLWLDPLGFGRYRGEWVVWDNVRDAIRRSPSGKVFAVLGRKGNAMQTTIREQPFAVPTTVQLDPGSYQLWEWDPDELNLTPGPDHVVHSPEQMHADMTVSIEHRPEDRVPKGVFVHMTDGPVADKYVRAGKVRVMPPTGVAADHEVAFAVQQAQAMLETELRARDEAIAVAKRALEELVR